MSAGMTQIGDTEANARRIANAEAVFGSSGQKLTNPGRVMIGEGILIKMCRKKPKPRQFFLFNDILVYGSILINKKRCNKQHIIPLESVLLVDIRDEGETRNGWVIRTPNKSFAVYAATPTEKNAWISHIHRCVMVLHQQCGRKPTSEFAAVWVPDGEATICMECNKTIFSLVNRRHHCRACGQVVCSKCSSRKYVLQNISRNPVRVCDKCFDNLSNNRPCPPKGASHPHGYHKPGHIPKASLKDTPLSDSSDDEDDSLTGEPSTSVSRHNYVNITPTTPTKEVGSHSLETTEYEAPTFYEHK
uniref:Pleckstrin homology domain-containing family F member 2 n=1 Tax=Rhabditophanes sp. KR3021 TaxID=114890 RepID=A0AC35U4I9_9BILA